MRNLLKSILLSLFILSCSSTKDYRYFDENNVEISKSKFNRIRLTNKLLDIPGDSINHKKLTLREKRGTLTNMPKFIETLKVGLNITLDATKPIAIIFYPGEDSCNSGGTGKKEWVKNWNKQLEDGLHQVAKIKPLYIYKDSKGLENYDGLLDWKQDPNQFIVQLFFKHHYPCSSFVVISSKGDYISYFGEFPKEFVWEAVQILKQTISSYQSHNSP